jgi:hypothetical protein
VEGIGLSEKVYRLSVSPDVIREAINKERLDDVDIYRLNLLNGHLQLWT